MFQKTPKILLSHILPITLLFILSQTIHSSLFSPIVNFTVLHHIHPTINTLSYPLPLYTHSTPSAKANTPPTQLLRSAGYTHSVALPPVHPPGTYNSPVHTKSNDSFVTILTNSELHCATPHTPNYIHPATPSLSTHTQHPRPRQTPHPLSYSALPATRIVSLRLQSTLLVRTSAPPPVISQHHMT
jgi:hypothetical protein